ncbi:MAG: LuxR C-terminal-related transcriptional regulator [gamma proteobacterium symbiont of Taylorina sp.]|nr:LuxR C-terminal-related transcriptional regulator [gamma proteobacterium symbiont of Taylorina sp.]
MNTGIKATFTGNEKDWGLYSPAEWNVFLKRCEGYPKKAIADYVCRSPDTVRTQEQSIRKKSGTHSMTQAVLKAVAKGIVTLSTLCIVMMNVIVGFYESQAVLKVITKGIVSLSTLCIVMISITAGFETNNEERDQRDLRRFPRTVRVSRANRSYRDYIV